MAGGMWRYEKFGKDVFGNTVYRAFYFGEFAGYRYKRSRREVEKIRKELGGRVGVPTWVKCPEWCIVGLNEKGERKNVGLG